MLAALRKGIGGWTAKIFIGLLVLSFAVWGVADIFGGYGRRSVATVGETEIPYETFQRGLRNQMSTLGARLGRALTLEEARTLGIDRQVLFTLIQQAALENQGTAMNLGISDKAIAERIVREPNFKGVSGEFSPTVFQQLLQANGMTEEMFVAQQRQAYVRQQLTDTLTSAIDLPKTFIRAADIYRNETRTVKYFLLPIDKIEAIEEPTAQVLQNYYESKKSAYTDPEFRKIGTLPVLPDEVAKTITVPDEDLKRYYESRQADYSKPEKRQVLQISVPDKAAAEEAYKKIQSGTSFEDIAKERGLSDDDVKLGWVTRNDLADKAIADAAFKLAKDEVSQPVAGELSTVLLKVSEIEPATVTSFDDAKDGIRKQVAKERALEQVLDLHNKIEDERANGTPLAEIAKSLGLSYVTADAIDRNGRGPGGQTLEALPGQSQILREAFNTEVNVETDPVETQDQGLIWYEVLDIIPQKIKTFEQVREVVAKDWRAAEQRTRLASLAQKLVDRARKGEKLDEIASSLGLEIKQSDPFKRNAKSDNLPAAAMAQAFALSDGGYGSAATEDGKARVVFEVVAVDRPQTLGGGSQ